MALPVDIIAEQNLTTGDCMTTGENDYILKPNSTMPSTKRKLKLPGGLIAEQHLTTGDYLNTGENDFNLEPESRMPSVKRKCPICQQIVSQLPRHIDAKHGLSHKQSLSISSKYKSIKKGQKRKPAYKLCTLCGKYVQRLDIHLKNTHKSQPLEYRTLLAEQKLSTSLKRQNGDYIEETTTVEELIR